MAPDNTMQAAFILAAAGSASAQYWTYPNPGLTNEGVSISINPSVKYQTMIGGGCSGAFGIACQQFGSVGLSEENSELVTQTLFDENIGGLSVVRNDIGSTPGYSPGDVRSILHECPDTPDQPLKYVDIGNDTCQLNLTQTALKYNPDLFVYATAWSAPGCMKTVGTEDNGGLICGVRGTDNCTYDWRQAYADYLVQYVRDYANRGVEISLLGAYNEPDFNPVYYASMLSDGFQAKDFLEYLYPTAKKAFPGLNISCCDATGARQERTLLYELEKAGGEDYFDIATWHNYQDNPDQPFNTKGKLNLQTEWADGTGDWNPNWDITGQLAEGFQWALYMHKAFTLSDTSGYLHWWCAQNTTGDNALIRLSYDSYFTSGRLWAFASYFRFARPGSVRIEAQSTAPDEVFVSAYVNKNGTVAIPVVNAAHFAYELEIDISGLNVSTATAFLTDNAHNVTMMGRQDVGGGMLKGMIEPRAMKTFFLE